MAVPAHGVRIREEADCCVERIAVVSDVSQLREAVATLEPSRVLLPSDALQEVEGFADDYRRSVWLYQPGAAIDTEARGGALRNGASGFRALAAPALHGTGPDARPDRR